MRTAVASTFSKTSSSTLPVQRARSATSSLAGPQFPQALQRKSPSCRHPDKLGKRLAWRKRYVYRIITISVKTKKI